MKIAITAANGQLGSAIVEATSKLTSKENVIALARTPEKAKHLGVEVRPGDYNNRRQLEESFQFVDVVLLVSGMDAPENRIQQHRNVIEAAKSAGVQKIVYTSIQGAEEGTAFSPIVQSNRQTEQDIINSGLDWVIGRNGIYIEPDVAYMETYKKMGGIFNCAGNNKCGYTTRKELAYAYGKMLTEDKHQGQIYNLHGRALKQDELTGFLNRSFGTSLAYVPMTFEAYRQERINELGDFLGTIIAGIYQGISLGKSNNPSDFLKAAGRPHQSWDDYFDHLKANRPSNYETSSHS